MAESITQAIISGSSSALLLAKTLLENPMIICTEIDCPFAISLEVDNYRQYASADVGDSVIISTESDSKKYISDNVCPGAWSWDVSGYIPGLKDFEIVTWFMPFVALNRTLITRAFEKGYRLIWKDIHCKVWQNVVIKDIEFSDEGDCRNKQPFRMTLKKINTMESLFLDQFGDVFQIASVAAGVMEGGALAIGSSTIQQATTDDIKDSL